MRGLSEESAHVQLELVGKSRMGQPLWLASIGHGPRHVLVIAGAHANEAVGSHTILAPVPATSLPDQPGIAYCMD